MILLIKSPKCKVVLFLAWFITLTTLYAQKAFNPLSLELGFGSPIPVTQSPVGGVDGRLEFLGPNAINMAMRYMHTETLGLRGHFGRSTYRASSLGTSSSISYNRLGLEGVVQLLNIIPIDYRIKEKFGLLITGGAALSMGKSALTSQKDLVGSLMGGGTLQFKLSDKMSLIGIGNGYFNVSQSIGYDGASNASGSSFTLELIVGLQWNLGDPKKRHADWY